MRPSLGFVAGLMLAIFGLALQALPFYRSPAAYVAFALYSAALSAVLVRLCIKVLSGKG